MSIKIEKDDGKYSLIKGWIRVGIDDSDIQILRTMTPQARKVHMRRKALILLEENQTNTAEAKSILEMSKLPAKNWTFEIPEGE